MKTNGVLNQRKQEKTKDQNVDLKRRDMLKMLGYAAPATILLLTADRVAAQSGPRRRPPPNNQTPTG